MNFQKVKDKIKSQLLIRFWLTGDIGIMFLLKRL